MPTYGDIQPNPGPSPIHPHLGTQPPRRSHPTGQTHGLNRGRGTILTCEDVEENPGPKDPKGRSSQTAQNNIAGPVPQEGATPRASDPTPMTALPPPGGEEAPNQPDHSNNPDPTYHGGTVSKVLLPENALPALTPSWPPCSSPPLRSPTCSRTHLCTTLPMH